MTFNPKRFKKVFLYSTIVLACFSVLGITVPFLFKEKVKSKLLEEIDEKVNAHVSFSDISFSAIKEFPLFTATLHDVVVTGNTIFEGDTLACTEQLRISFDIKSIVKGEQINIKSIRLIQPKMFLSILNDGTPNYDILIKQDSLSAFSDTSDFKLNVDRWHIENGTIILDDQQDHIFIRMTGIHHTGKGDFSEEISDLNVQTEIEEVTLTHKKIKYLDRKKITADLIMAMNLNEMKFTFKDHDFKINHFAFGFNGYFKLLGQGIETDMTFGVKETSFKNLLSILPGIYLPNPEDIKTNGHFTCDGFVKGILDSRHHKFPRYKLNIEIINSMFQYPSLPEAIHDINFHLHAENKYNTPDSMHVHIHKLQLKMGEHPVDGYINIKGSRKPFIEAGLNASIDLADLKNIYPLDSLTMKGQLNMNVLVKGKIDKSTLSFPFVDIKLNMDSGYVKAEGYDTPIEHINMNVEVINTNGISSDTRITLNTLKYSIEEEPFIVTGTITDLSDPLYDLYMEGLMDMEKLTHIFPVEGVHMSGEIDTRIQFKGRESDIEARRYKALEATGSVLMKDIQYSSSNVTRPVTIHEAFLKFNPDKIVLKKCQGNIGRTSFALSGHLYDYMAIVLHNHDMIRADLNLQCDTINLNDWISRDTTIVSGSANTSTGYSEDTLSGFIQFPDNIDITFDSYIEHLIFGNMTLRKLTGEITIANGLLTLRETGFEAADAVFRLKGSYDPKDKNKPLFELMVEVTNLEIKKAYDLFYTVQSAAPSAKNTNGIFSTVYTLKGELHKNYQPDMNTLQGSGKITIKNARLNGVKLLNHISKFTKKQELKDPAVNDIVMDTEIKGGKVYIKPCELQMGKYLVDVEGSCSFENEIDYLVKIAVPPVNKIKIPIRVYGNIDDPEIKVGKGNENFDFNTL